VKPVGAEVRETTKERVAANIRKRGEDMAEREEQQEGEDPTASNIIMEHLENRNVKESYAP